MIGQRTCRMFVTGLACLSLPLLVSSCQNASYDTAAYNASADSVETTVNGLVADPIDMSFKKMSSLKNGQADTGERSKSRASRAETIFCPILQDRAIRSDCDYFDQIWANLRTGTGAFDAPEEMTRGETRTVSFAVARNQSTSPAEVLGSAPDEQFKLKVARRMAALLQGEGFAIEPRAIQYQDLFIGDGARWEWQVTALKARRHRLSLSAYVVVASPDGKQKENLLKTVTRDISVTVTWAQRYQDVVDDITSASNTTKGLFASLTALLIALIAFQERIRTFFRNLFGR